MDARGPTRSLDMDRQQVQDIPVFFGISVNLAARIATEARGGEVLVSSLLKELTEGAGAVGFGQVFHATGAPRPERTHRTCRCAFYGIKASNVSAAAGRAGRRSACPS